MDAAAARVVERRDEAGLRNPVALRGVPAALLQQRPERDSKRRAAAGPDRDEAVRRQAAAPDSTP